MGGSYPRTENDIIEEKKLEIAKNNQRYIDHMGDSVRPITDEPRREIIPAHSNLKIPSGIIRTSRAPKSEIVEVPVYGQVDVSQIDSIHITPATPEQARAAGLNPNSMDRPEIYNLMAKLEIMNPENRLPDFKRFSQREDMVGRSRPEQVKEYLDLRQGLVHRAAIELQTGIKIDIGALSDPVKSRTILSDPGIVQTFSRVKDIGVSPDYFKGVVLIDLVGQGGGREAERVREEMRGDLAAGSPTKAAYNPFDRQVYVDPGICTTSFVNNGGVYHEMFHGLRYQEVGDMGLILGIDRKHPAVPVIESCEEAAENIRTARFMGESKGYAELLYERYGINPKRPSAGTDSIIWNSLHRKDAPEFAAEAVATFKEADSSVFKAFQDSLAMRKKDFGDDRIGQIVELSKQFYRSADSNEAFKEAVETSIGIRGYLLPHSPNATHGFKKFKMLNLEGRV